MSTRQDERSHKGVEDEVWMAISALEQILEAMPNDRTSLDALSHAYEQIGDHTQAKEYMLRLANVLLDEGDREAARKVVEKIKPYAGGDDSRVDALVNRTEAMPSEVGPASPAAGTEGESEEDPARTGGRIRTGVNVAEELAFAWSLLEAGQLTQEEYASVAQDLSEMSSKDPSATVSVLHALEFRTFPGMGRLIAYVARAHGTPYVALGNFEFRPDNAAVIPLDFAVRHGALVFESMGPDALVAVMNPASAELRSNVQTLAKRRCHFFVTHPAEFDAMVERVAELMEDAQ
jgi:hypothetical protein